MNRESQRHCFSCSALLQTAQYGRAESLASGMRHEGNVDQSDFFGTGIDDHATDGVSMMFQQQIFGIGIATSIACRLHVLLHGDQGIGKRRVGRYLPQVVPGGCIQAYQKILIASVGIAYGQVVEILRQRVHILVLVLVASSALVIMTGTHIPSNAPKENMMTPALDVFTPLVGSTFTVDTLAGAVELLLTEAREYPRKGLPEKFPTPLSLIFAGSPDRLLLQDNYCIEHPALGRHVWCIAPVSSPGARLSAAAPAFSPPEMQQRYQILFA